MANFSRFFLGLFPRREPSSYPPFPLPGIGGQFLGEGAIEMDSAGEHISESPHQFGPAGILGKVSAAAQLPAPSACNTSVLQSSSVTCRNPRNRLLLVPLGVRRPPAAGQALRGHPPEQARRAYSAGVEGVPAVAARARPLVVRAWGPVAQRAADTGTGAVAVLVVPDILTEFGFHKGGHFPSLSHRIRGAATGG